MELQGSWQPCSVDALDILALRSQTKAIWLSHRLTGGNESWFVAGNAFAEFKVMIVGCSSLQNQPMVLEWLRLTKYKVLRDCEYL